jgi:acetolactate synthase-1/2/3 large subunit
MFKPITKWSVKVETIGRTADILHNAFRVATSGRPGPVNVELPLDVIEGQAEIEIPRSGSYQTFPNYYRVRPDAESVLEARDLLLRAKRAVIVAGGGVITSQAWAELAEFVELTAIPVATTITGKGAITEEYELRVGVVGSYTRRCANETVSQADTVLFIGCKTGSVATNKWQIPPKGTKIIHADIDPLEIGRSYPTDLGLVGDAKLVLQDLISSMREVKRSKKGLRDQSFAKWCKELKDKWHKKVLSLENSDDIPIKPPRVIREIQALLNPEDILVGDVGYACVWTAAHYSVRRVGRKYIGGRGLAGLGFGFPAAIGAQLAAPNNRVVCVTGDGSFSAVIQELTTALSVNAPVVVVVLNNSCLNFERQYMHYYLGDVTACEFDDVDYAKIAQAFGCFGQRVLDPRDLRGTLEKALKSEKPAVVDVVIDKDLVPPVTFYDRFNEGY